MQMVDNLKQIVEYVCENFEEKLEISLPEDVKELYRYINGSKFFSLSHDFWNLEDRVLKVYPDIESLKEKDAYMRILPSAANLL